MDAIAFAELDYIFSQLSKEDLAKIPEDLKNFFKEHKDQNYNCKIDLSLPLSTQNLTSETIKYLCAINYMYLSDMTEQHILYKIYNKNDDDFAEKTDIYKIFDQRKEKKVKNYSPSNEIHDLTVYENNSFIKKLINKIKFLFNH